MLLRERVERPRAGERQIERVVVVILGRVRDVLTAALFPAAAQHHRRRDAGEAAGHGELAPLRPVAVDLETEPGEPGIQIGWEGSHIGQPTQTRLVSGSVTFLPSPRRTPP